MWPQKGSWPTSWESQVSSIYPSPFLYRMIRTQHINVKTFTYETLDFLEDIEKATMILEIIFTPAVQKANETMV